MLNQLGSSLVFMGMVLEESLHSPCIMGVVMISPTVNILIVNAVGIPLLESFWNLEVCWN